MIKVHNFSLYHYFFLLLLFCMPFSNTYAQNRTDEILPDGAIARLGKGGINVIEFSPDGVHLAIGTGIGVWIYDVVKEKRCRI